VAREVGQLLGVASTHMARYEPDGMVTGVGAWSADETHLAVGTRAPVGGTSVIASVFRTGRPARVDSYEGASDQIASMVQELGIRSSVGAPIVVDGRPWGVMVASTNGPEPLPPDTESRIAAFTDLVATAISNTEARAELAASRARIVAATDQTRRRFERDLHDGAQQRLVSLALELRGAETMAPPEAGDLRERLSRVEDGVNGVLESLRELSRGIHPAILSESGLGPALRALARRSAVPVKLDVDVGTRVEEDVEVAAYYVVSETLANAAKHAQASVAEVRVEARDGILQLAIHDDGVGGADPARGTGLIGLTDRVEALGGTIAIVSPAGGGTSVDVELPVAVGVHSGT
jgi:signal transduction histidine kinase